MLQSEFLDSIPFLPAFRPPRAPRLPVFIEPAGTDEALLSWLLRLATRLGVSLHTLISETFGIDDRKGHSRWWCRPHPGFLALISERTGLPITQVRQMTFDAMEPVYRDDEASDRFAGRWFRGVARAGHFHHFGVCGMCLEGDPEPWVRTSWLIGWMALCPRHGTLLITRCEKCRSPLRFAPFDAVTPFSPAVCSRCGQGLINGVYRLADPAAWRLQAALLRGKTSGFTVIPGIGSLAWRELIALADVLIGMVWMDTTLAEHDAIFSRYLIPSPGTMRHEVHVYRDRHDSLCFLAWLLEGWPDSVGATVARDMLERWSRSSRDYLSKLLLPRRLAPSVHGLATLRPRIYEALRQLSERFPSNPVQTSGRQSNNWSPSPAISSH